MENKKLEQEISKLQEANKGIRVRVFFPTFILSYLNYRS